MFKSQPATFVRDQLHPFAEAASSIVGIRARLITLAQTFFSPIGLIMTSSTTSNTMQLHLPTFNMIGI